MTTLDNTHPFSPAKSAGPADFVSTDMAALASHMDDCASTRSRFFSLQSVLESAHTLLCARMVTAAIMAVIILSVVGIL